MAGTGRESETLAEALRAQSAVINVGGGSSVAILDVLGMGERHSVVHNTAHLPGERDERQQTRRARQAARYMAFLSDEHGGADFEIDTGQELRPRLLVKASDTADRIEQLILNEVTVAVCPNDE